MLSEFGLRAFGFSISAPCWPIRCANNAIASPTDFD